MRESAIRKALKKRVEEYGGEIRAVAWVGRRNAPDVLALLGHEAYIENGVGGHYFIETKRPTKDATEAQAREHERLRDAGCRVEVITTIEQLDAWLPPL